MAAFKSWTDFSLWDQQPRAIRLLVLSTADSFQSSITPSIIIANQYSSMGLTHVSMHADLRGLRTSEYFRKCLIHLICCLTCWTFARNALAGSPLASSTEPRYVTLCTRAMHSSFTASFRVLRLLRCTSRKSLSEQSSYYTFEGFSLIFLVVLARSRESPQLERDH